MSPARIIRLPPQAGRIPHQCLRRSWIGGARAALPMSRPPRDSWRAEEVRTRDPRNRAVEIRLVACVSTTRLMLAAGAENRVVGGR